MHNGCIICEQRRRKWMLIRVDRTSLSVQSDWPLCWLRTHVLKPYRIIPWLLSLHVAATSQEHYSTVTGYEATIMLLLKGGGVESRISKHHRVVLNGSYFPE